MCVLVSFDDSETFSGFSRILGILEFSLCFFCNSPGFSGFLGILENSRGFPMD